MGSDKRDKTALLRNKEVCRRVSVCDEKKEKRREVLNERARQLPFVFGAVEHCPPSRRLLLMAAIGRRQAT